MATRGEQACEFLVLGEDGDLARHKGLPGVDAVPYLWCGGEWTAVALPLSDVRAADEALMTADGLFAEVDAE
ncbi:hypothetical protein P3102_25160 [Amycolatopsis sp. QT-25]|uniref:hypothetical protein n=1 Tax=Amycolatopsis sp. QT-25 TaxID=3034022 RepID=UPI0023EBAC0C|nr:hypothetical protein [Amycolatopsis sp. QT-25]WET83476.1 hypothetical protein P3102_25160 [Amycolatopsis sp. QT-25]